MKTKIVGAILSVIFVAMATGCDFSDAVNRMSEADEALEYNDRIVGIQASVVEAMLVLAASFQEADAASMRRDLQKLQRVTDKALVDVTKIAPMEGDQGLLKSVTPLFQFYKRLAYDEFVTLVNILSKEELTEEDLMQIDRITASIDKEETMLEADFSAAQARFAKKFNMPLVENELQEKIDNL